MTLLTDKAHPGLLAVAAQILLALAGGAWLAHGVVADGSGWMLAGAVGAFASLVAGYAVAIGVAMLLGSVVFARDAARYLQKRDATEAFAPGKGARVLDAMAATLAMSVIVAGCLATAVVLWLGADAAPIAAVTRFAVLGGFLAALVPRGLHAFG